MSMTVGLAIGGALCLNFRNLAVAALAEKLNNRGKGNFARPLLKFALRLPDLPWEAPDFRGLMVAVYANIAEPREDGLEVLCNFLEKHQVSDNQVQASLLLAKAQALGAVRRPYEAYLTLDQNLELFAMVPESYPTALAQLLLNGYQSGRVAEAEPKMSVALQAGVGLESTDPGLLASIHSCVALLYRSMHRYEEAYTHLREGLSLRESADTLSLLAETELELCRVEDCKVHLKKREDYGPRPGSEHFLYLALGEEEKARDLLRVYMESLGPEPDTEMQSAGRFTEGTIHLQLEEFESARACFLSALELTVSDVQHLAYSASLVMAEAGLGHGEDGLRRISDLKLSSKELLRNTRLDFWILMAEFLCYYHLGRFAQALKLSSRLQEMATPLGRIQVTYQLGLCEQAQGSLEAARDFFQRSYEMGPTLHFGKLAWQALEAM